MENTAAAMATLPDDVLREILVRVADAAVLFRCATACKRWCNLVADPSFLHRRWPDGLPNSSSLVGFFALNQVTHLPVFVPTQRSPLDTGCRLLYSFIPGAINIIDHVELLTSHGGLLLLRNCYDDGFRLVVCDPVKGTCNILPPLFRSEYRVVGYAILTSGDYPKNSQKRIPSPDCTTFFKVLIIVDNGRQYIVRTFSSDEPRWTAPQNCFGRQDIYPPYEQRSAIVYHGNAYWVFRCRSNYYTLNVSVETGHVSLTKLLIRSDPHKTSQARLSIAVDGTLSLIRRRWKSNQVDIWTRQESETGEGTMTEWLCTRTIQLEGPMEEPCCEMICVGERSGMLLFEDSGVHLTNLKTGATEDVTRQFQHLMWKLCVPYEMDWPALFMSRLGGQQ